MSNSPISPLFWQHWQHHHSDLLRLALRLLKGNAADAEDAVSNTLLRASQKFPEEPGAILNERAWLSRLLYNTCMDMHRHRWRFVEPVHEPPDAPLEPRPAADASPEQSLLERERSRELEAQIQSLPPGLRTPLTLRFQQDMSYDDIARELGLTNSNVRKRIQLACSALRNALRQSDEH